MKYLNVLLLSMLPLLNADAGDEAAATEASVRDLLAVTQSDKMIDAMFAQIDQVMKASMNQSMAGHPMNAEQRKIVDDMESKLVALFKEGLNWKEMEPGLVDLYRKTFTEEEIKGMLAFYQTPAGKAVIAKMPVVLQQSMQLGQSRMATLTPKLQQLMKDTEARLRAASGK